MPLQGLQGVTAVCPWHAQKPGAIVMQVCVRVCHEICTTTCTGHMRSPSTATAPANMQGNAPMPSPFPKLQDLSKPSNVWKACLQRDFPNAAPSYMDTPHHAPHTACAKARHPRMVRTIEMICPRRCLSQPQARSSGGGGDSTRPQNSQAHPHHLPSQWQAK